MVCFKIIKIRLISVLFFISFCISETYWVRYGWQAFNSAGDARILSLGGETVTDYGTSISPLFNHIMSKNSYRDHHFSVPYDIHRFSLFHVFNFCSLVQRILLWIL